MRRSGPGSHLKLSKSVTEQKFPAIEDTRDTEGTENGFVLCVCKFGFIRDR